MSDINENKPDGAAREEQVNGGAETGEINQKINLRALFSDETGSYRVPVEPGINEKVTIWFRTLKDNVTDVILIYNEEDRFKMKKSQSDSMFDYYSVKLMLGNELVNYYFELTNGVETYHYHKLGVSEELYPAYYFKIQPGLKVPDWAKGAVLYQIFVDRFSRGDNKNDVLDREYFYINQEPVTKVKDWNQYPSTLDVGSFYGGDLMGVFGKLDYLQSLGIDGIYFNPLFVSPSNHKYDVQDYEYIDPHFGAIVVENGDVLPENAEDNREATRYITRVTNRANLEASNALFAQLVDEMHKRGMKVIIDGVFNHCGSFNKWLDRERIYEKEEGYMPGAYVSDESPYRSFFKFHDDDWPYNDSYQGWWGHPTLPKLNYEESPFLYEYIMRIAKKWVSAPFYVDGWRLDVAADLGRSEDFNHHFWKDFRNNVKGANHQALIVAEHYGDPSAWLQGDEWDTVMNYDAFMEPVSWFLTGMEKHSDAYNEGMLNNSYVFFDSMWRNMSRFHTQSLQAAMNQLSNHDHSRFLTRTNRTIGRVTYLPPEAAEEEVNLGVYREAVVIQMTWPGAPTLYYGDEAGVCGFTDPDSRRTYPWGKEDLELIEFHRYMVNIHRNHKALKRGSIKQLVAEPGVIGYGRFLLKDRIIVVVNNLDESRVVQVPVWEIGVSDEDVMARLMVTNEIGYNIGKITFQVKDGQVTIDMQKKSAIVLCAKAS